MGKDDPEDETEGVETPDLSGNAESEEPPLVEDEDYKFKPKDEEKEEEEEEHEEADADPGDDPADDPDDIIAVDDTVEGQKEAEDKLEEHEEAMEQQHAKPAPAPKGIIMGKDRKTEPYMTKYEWTRLIGDRAKMIDNNEPSTLEDLHGETNSMKIARMEILARKLPMIVRRKMPDQSVEIWRADELELPTF